MNLSEINFNEIDFEEIGIWPLPLRVVVIITICIVISFLGYKFIINPKISNIESKVREQKKIKNDFRKKYGLSANLEAYQEQVKEINIAYEKLLTQIPTSGYIPELIDTISNKADVLGLTYTAIKPGEPVIKENFYKQLSIDLTIIGNYHGFGEFISELSKLPRIVTLHDFIIKKRKNDSDGEGPLVMEVEARTYWIDTSISESENDNKKGDVK